MQLKIQPGPTLPTIFFSTSLPSPPRHLPTPSAWEWERQKVVAAGLELPRTIYAFDKSSWISSVVEDVTFDLHARRLSVVFQDGFEQEWPLTDSRCLDTLHGLLDDVLAAAAERERARSASSPAATETAPVKSHKDKKRGSKALFHFVANLVSSNNTSRPSSTAAPAPAPPAASAFELVSGLLSSQHPLRFRARSALVDAFHRFALGEIKARLQLPGYAIWAATSMLRYTLEDLRQAEDEIERLGGSIPPPQPFYSVAAPAITRRSATHLFYDDDYYDSYDDDGDSYDDRRAIDVDIQSLAGSAASTATDGSSVHTPLSTPVGTETRRRGPPPEVEAYHQLQRRAADLEAMLNLLHEEHAKEESARRMQLDILAVHSRRRAWSNRALLGRALSCDSGLASPRVSSPLARCEVVTPESVEERRAYHSLSRKRAVTVPVELDVVEEEEQLQQQTLVFPVDAEDEDDERVYAPPPPPLTRPRIRVRTLSSRPLLRPVEGEHNTAQPQPPSKTKLSLQHLFADDSPFGDVSAEFAISVVGGVGEPGEGLAIAAL